MPYQPESGAMRMDVFRDARNFTAEDITVRWIKGNSVVTNDTRHIEDHGQEARRKRRSQVSPRPTVPPAGAHDNRPEETRCPNKEREAIANSESNHQSATEIRDVQDNPSIAAIVINGEPSSNGPPGDSTPKKLKSRTAKDTTTRRRKGSFRMSYRTRGIKNHGAHRRRHGQKARRGSPRQLTVPPAGAHRSRPAETRCQNEQQEANVHSGSGQQSVAEIQDVQGSARTAPVIINGQFSNPRPPRDPTLKMRQSRFKILQRIWTGLAGFLSGLRCKAGSEEPIAPTKHKPASVGSMFSATTKTQW